MNSPDARLGDRSLFPTLEADVYAAHAAIAPPSLPVREAVTSCMAEYARSGVAAVAKAAAQRDELRGRLATLFGAHPDGFAFTQNTSMGVLAVANCFPWKRGDGVILFEGEFPTNVTPWLAAAKRHDLTIHWLSADEFRTAPERALYRLSELLSAHDIRLLAVSAVAFQTGFQMPIATMAERCRAEGAEIFVDGIQAAGIVPLDFETLGIDYFAAGGHKWLMGPEGTGFVWIAPHRLAAFEPNFASWLSHESCFEFLFHGPGLLRYDRPMRADATVLEGGMSNVLGFTALSTSVEIIEQLSVEAISRHVADYHDRLESGLVSRGWSSVRAPGRAEQSGILSLSTPTGIDGSAMVQHLDRCGVVVNWPDGFIRFSPHWPNGMNEVEVVLAAVDAFRG